MAGIYGIRCKVNNKIYVGQTKGDFNKRFNAHKCNLNKNRGIQKLQADWNLYGEDAFELVVIEEGLEDKDFRNEREKYYIDLYNSINSGYNTNPGGIGQGNFGRLNGMYGKHHTEKSLKLMSEHRKGLTCGENNWMYGKHHTKETKKKLSNKLKGRVQSKEERQRRSLAMQKAMLRPENIRIRKELGLRNRTYTDELIRQLREEYKRCGSIKEVATKHNLVYEVCRQAIKGYGRFKDR